MRTELPAVLASPGWTSICVVEGETEAHTFFIPLPRPRSGPSWEQSKELVSLPHDVGYAEHGQVAGGPQRTTHRLVTVPSLGGCVPWFLHSHRSASVPEPRRGWCAPRDTSGQSTPHLRSRGLWCCTPISHVHFAATMLASAAATHPLSAQSHTQGTGPQAHHTEALVVRCRRPRIRSFWMSR